MSKIKGLIATALVGGISFYLGVESGFTGNIVSIVNGFYKEFGSTTEPCRFSEQQNSRIQR